MTATTYTPTEALKARLASAVAVRDRIQSSAAEGRKSLEGIKAPAGPISDRVNGALADCSRIENYCGEVSRFAKQAKRDDRDFVKDCEWIEGLNHSMTHALEDLQAEVAELT